MTVLTDAAEQARLAREAAQEAEREEQRKALRQAALDAVRGMLVREDDTTMTLDEAGLDAVHTDLGNRLVVVSDGSVALASSDPNDDGNYGVRLAIMQDGKWTNASDRLRSLADLGDALMAVG